MKKLYDNALILAVLIVTIFFRFYDVVSRYTLGYESVRDANVAIIGSRTLHLPLTGPFSSLGPFTFGPWYWYQLILFHLILPIAFSSWILLGITSVIFIFLLFKIGELLGDKKLGFTIGILAAVSQYLIAWSTLLTNPGFIFLYAALSIWIFLKIIKQNTTIWWGLALGLSIGIGINIHYQMLPYLAMIVILSIVDRKKILHSIAAGVGVAITFIPLLIFDLMNHWYMLHTMIFSYMNMKNRIYVANSWKIYLFHFWPTAWSSLLSVPVYVGSIIIVALIFLLTYLTIKKKISKELLALSLFFAVAFIQLRYYNGERFLLYMHYLIPFIFIYTGYLIWHLNFLKKGKYLYFIVIFIFIILALPSSLKEIKSQNAVDTRAFANAIVKQYPHSKFNFYKCDKENQDVVMSVMFVLDAQNLISRNGMKMALPGSLCEDNIHASNIKIVPVTFSNKEGILIFKDATDKDISLAGWAPYTMQKLYNDSVFWWIGKKL